MSVRANPYDTNTELHVYRFRNGIKVQRPEVTNTNAPSIGDLLKNSFTVYFLNTDGRVKLMNESLANIYDLESPQQALGKNIFDFSAKETAEKIHHNDVLVMKKEENFFSEETVVNKLDEESIPFLSLKYPWYNEQNKVCGLLGMSIALEQHPRASSLNTITNFGFLAPNKTANNNALNSLSKRELEIMKFLVRGNSAKQIATLLYLSVRTVEHHIANIKAKTNISSKYELANVFFDQFC